MTNRTNILFLGDFAPNEKQQLLLHTNSTGLLDELVGERTFDHLAINLEAPITKNVSATPKTGPALKLRPCIVDTLKASRITIASLANNHILDFGEAGVLDTIRELESQSIFCLGAGRALEEATRPIVLTDKAKNAMTVAIIAVAESEFNIATKNSAGAAPLDVIDNARAIQDLNAEHDHVVVCVHGGVEHLAIPPLHLRKACRFFVEQGASAVICSHTHLPGCYERYQGAFISYGLGNLLMKPRPAKQNWNYGYAVAVSLGQQKGVTAELLPYVMKPEEARVEPMSDSDKSALFIELTRQNQILEDENMLREALTRFYSRKRRSHVSLFTPKFLRTLSRLPGGQDVLYRIFQSNITGKINTIRNPSHREALLANLRSLERYW
ncbi:MAG: hypothetical protein GVY36_02550 [Verrucomicrobia bacterium]|nr:hypothetical protein [Verrucomicrobiota bacterium]